MRKFDDILALYLCDDGLPRDIVKDLAMPMGIRICEVYRIPKKYSKICGKFLAMTAVDNDVRSICINCLKVQDADDRKFLISYQLAEIIKCKDDELYSCFNLNSVDLDVYDLAKKIYNRRTKKEIKLKTKKK